MSTTLVNMPQTLSTMLHGNLSIAAGQVATTAKIIRLTLSTAKPAAVVASHPLIQIIVAARLARAVIE